MDTFLNLELYKQQDKEYIEQLRHNHSEMTKLRINLAALPEARKALENEQRKFKALEQSKAADIVKYHNALLEERVLRSSLIKELRELSATYHNILGNRNLFDKVAAIDGANIIVGKEYFGNVKDIVNQFATLVATKSTELNSDLDSKIKELN